MIRDLRRARVREPAPGGPLKPDGHAVDTGPVGANDPEVAAAPARTVNSATLLVVQYVRDRGGDEAVAELVRRAEEERTVLEPEDERAWGPHDRLVALVEALADVTGDPGAARRVGESALSRGMHAWARVVRALGSPGPVFRRLGSLLPRLSTAFAYEWLGASRGRGAVALAVAAGATPSAALCGAELVVTPSVGVAVHRRDGDGYEALLAAADAAMYRAKARSRTDEAEIRRLPRRAV